MGNEQKLENLKQLIRSSIMLSVQEKEEWLGLAELMNDKQMSELLELLGQKKNVVTPPAVAPSASTTGSATTSFAGTATQGTTPSLSHISNLPNTMIPEGANAFAKANTSTTAAERILSKPTPKTAQTTSTIAAPTAKSVAIKPQEAPKSQETPSSISTEEENIKPTPPQNYTMQVPQEASSLTVASLRKNGFESIAASLKNIAVNYGYFTLLEYFEQSPLYVSYIKLGESILSGKKTSDPEQLTTQEFEMVTDLMQSLRLNRL